MGHRGYWIIGAALALALGAASPVRGDFGESFTFSGTIQPFNDLDNYVYPGSTAVNSFHVLPGLAAGDVLTGSGSVTFDALGRITSATLQASATGDFSFSYQSAPGDLDPVWNYLNDPANPRAGFSLLTGTTESNHPAVLPATASYDSIGSVFFHSYTTGAMMTVKVIHPSFLAPDIFEVPVNVNQFRIVPEPASATLLALGALALAGGRRRVRARGDGSTPLAERPGGPDEGVV
ncbi:MAG TPA: hypothetical protein VG406_16450 [Isosphaeraceae bacterium]|jgi:hypothetical protein|nr:hypothetical protein [Isosphaeraceae bacterium]